MKPRSFSSYSQADIKFRARNCKLRNTLKDNAPLREAALPALLYKLHISSCEPAENIREIFQRLEL